MPRLSAHFLPDLITEDALAGSTVVVIDVLRATTTLVHALAAGAREVVPCGTIDEARQAAARLADQKPLLGGERGGVRIEGFDLGNSPDEYRAEAVAGRTLVFTTSNGTRAMLRARQARRILLAAFVNRAAALAALAGEDSVDLLCAGTHGEVTGEDVLLAGALVEGLADRCPPESLNDQAWLARDAWRTAKQGPLADVLRLSRGGRNLLAEGFPHDIATAAQLDRFEVVPVLDWQRGTIRAGG